LKLHIANQRWNGVPFYFITGKRMSKKLTEIQINYHSASDSIFQLIESPNPIVPNVLTVTIQPDEGFDLQFHVKSIGQPLALTSQRLQFRYADIFGPLPDAYEILLIDVILGDQTLFVRFDEVENAWRLYSSLIQSSLPVYPYRAGNWGPIEAKRINPSSFLVPAPEETKE
jgi:glucose-6-phosphate 1-dehydrogenase